jgi:hypothetical protein
MADEAWPEVRFAAGVSGSIFDTWFYAQWLH